MELIKHRISHYWAHRAEAFQAQRIREFADEKHARWLAEFKRYIPHERTLRVLDLGTGTGFFASLGAGELRTSSMIRSRSRLDKVETGRQDCGREVSREERNMARNPVHL